jgi:periplasmic protein CpxP/Spy
MQYWTVRVAILYCGVAMALACAAAQPAFAQEPGPPPPDEMGAPPDVGEAPPAMNVDKQLAKMVKRYGLSDTQETQVRPILVDVKQKLDAVFQDSSFSPEDRDAKIKSIHDDEVARISAIMTSDQRARYQKDQARTREDQGPGGPDGPPPPPNGDGGGGPPPPLGDQN